MLDVVKLMNIIQSKWVFVVFFSIEFVRLLDDVIPVTYVLKKESKPTLKMSTLFLLILILYSYYFY